MASVTFENTSKNYGNVKAVEDFNLKIGDGEFIVLVGPSGCGKSTTLRMMAGLEDVSKGLISIDGKVINKVHPKNRDIAMVFQNYALYPHLSVKDNISFGIRAQKLPKDEIEERTFKAAKTLGLEDLLQRRPGELSGGQKQRVAMGRAIVRKPKVFLFDEPLSNLDAKLRHRMRTEMKKLHKQVGTTTIYVTHDQVEAMTLADRIVIMRDGRIEQVGKPNELYQKPSNTFVASFIGTPAMNFINGEVFEKDNQLAIKLTDNINFSLSKKAVSKGQKVILGIRPENLVANMINQKTNKKELTLNAQVTVSEPMGHETLLLCETNYGEITGKMDSNNVLPSNNLISFNVSPEKIHVFDLKTGMALE